MLQQTDNNVQLTQLEIELQQIHRELEIEHALDRVRTRAMAMKTSDELRELIGALFTELTGLDLVLTRCVILIFDPLTNASTWWMANSETPSSPIGLFVKYHGHEPYQAYLHGWKEQSIRWQYVLQGETKTSWDKYLFEETELGKLPNFVIEGMKAPGRVYLSCSFNNFGCLTLASLEPLCDEHFNILLRFAKVFDLTYTRFNDLKQAEAQAREAQIQLALERVRARTMAMQHSDELLDVASILFQQVKALGVPQWNCGFNIWEIGDKEFTFYPGTPDGIISQSPCKIPLTDHPTFKSFDESRRRGDDLFVYEKEGEFQKGHYQYMLSLPGVGDLLKSMLNGGFEFPTYQIDHVANFAYGNLIFITYEHFPEMHDVFKRFAKVFEQTYTRFLDLQKAEAQAREGQIQLALERVRAKTMAMQKPSEFVEVIDVIGEQFINLGFEFDWVNFSPGGHDVSKAIDIWNFVVVPGMFQGATRLVIPYFDHPVFSKAKESIAEYLNHGNEFTVVLLDKKEKDLFLDHLFTNTIYKDLPNEVKADHYSQEVYLTSNVVLKDTWLSLGTYKKQFLTEEQVSIEKRLAREFGQAYTRFLELQKAEAQAREAKIEAALERVRSRTMAMQVSSELTDVASLLFAQVLDLGIKTWTTGFNVWKDDNSSYVDYITSPTGGFVEPYTVYSDAGDAMKEVSNARKSGAEFYVQYLEGKKLRETYEALMKCADAGQFENIQQSGFNFPTRQYDHFVFGSKVSLMFITYDPVPEAHDLFKRLGKVFEQTYTRFLDLQNAEAQAREAKIETGLERVRSRTMAMHKTSELQDVIHTVHKELLKLNVSVDGGSFVVINKDVEPRFLCWGSGGTADTSEEVDVPHFNMPFLTNLMEGIRRGPGFFTEEFSQREKIEYFTKLFEHKPWSDLSDQEKSETLSSPGGYTRSVAVSNHTSIFIINHQGRKFTDGENDILKRFAKVFEQTYTRFLDLQKAEAQAREAQIQLALERVRARTMAMHRSEELAETAQVMFHQLQELGGIPDRIAIGVADEPAGVVNFWSTDQSGSHIDKNFKARLNEEKVMAKTYQAWKDHKKSIVIDLHGEDVKEWIKFAREEMGVVVKDEFIKDRRVHSFGFFSHGWILVTTHEPQSAETIQILERFASVFSLTYRRFLDLEKAEAQAREAQIQLGLERVQAKAMAMHHSDELKDLVKILFVELSHLDVKLGASLISLYDESMNSRSWFFSHATNEPAVLFIPNTTQPFYQEMLGAWKERELDWNYCLAAEAKIEWEDFLFTKSDFALMPPAVKEDMRKPDKVFFSASFYNYGSIQIAGTEPFSAESIDIIRRFGKVFELSYTRFLDLQKAEAQAREAQIEAALEKVRSCSLAMHKSEDIQHVVQELYTRLLELNIRLDAANILFFKEGSRDIECWTGSNLLKYQQATFPYADLPFLRELNEAHENGEELFKRFYSKEQKDALFDYVFAETELKKVPAERKQFVFSGQHHACSIALVQNVGVNLNRYFEGPFSDEEDAILKRFARVFHQAYTRFLDLQKAETAAREARIEAALERVRSRSMAMHQSTELTEVADVLFQQLRSLGGNLWACGFVLCKPGAQDDEVWFANENGVLPPVTIPNTKDPTHNKMYEGWKNKMDLFTGSLEGPALKSHYDYMLSLKSVNALFENIRASGLSFPTSQTWHAAYFKYGYVLTITLEAYPDEQVFVRFAKVFEQTYTRFLDLQKAEAQAREAQIEAALERVRSRAMAMKDSSDLNYLISHLFNECTRLDLVLDRCLVMIVDPKTLATTWILSNPETPDQPTNHFVKHHTNKPYLEYLQAWKRRDEKWNYLLEGDEKKQWDNVLFNETELSKLPGAVKEGMQAITSIRLNCSFGNFGSITLSGFEPLTDSQSDILLRMTKVFDLTYTRYNDLKQAEAQTREATIEAALEKVRGKAMAMHNSTDLSVTASMVFTELRKLGINPIRSGVGLLSKETRKAQLYSATSSANGDSLSLVGWVLLDGHPVLENIYNSWLNEQDYFPELNGPELHSYYQLLLKGLPVTVPDSQNEQKQYGHFLTLSVGCLYAWSLMPYTDTEVKVLKRFAAIIDLTFRRYIELQKSEANAKEAIKQAALDRIRADIASMRTVADLDRITPLIWNELSILGISFIRCGVFIMDDAQQLIHTFLSTPTGQAIASFHLPYSTPGNIQDVLNHWRQNQSYIDKWDDSAFKTFADILVEQGSLTSAQQYLKTIPSGGFYLHFLPFLQGMLYVGNTEQLGEEEMKLVEAVADAFSTAYARYEDFNKLEAAKQRVDKALVDLKLAQSQLIQAEKMASLGELTAGIAHEIQNPLNFVNNFSDVNKELLEELKVEWLKLSNHNEDDNGLQILHDLLHNENKINHHGKRADAIVKGMLQHSRASTGKKEPTDINALAEEYLRLSYHGLRAKNKNLNVVFKTNFDESIGLVEVVAQDIGRVLLNLYNNAFHAAQPPHPPKEGFEPHDKDKEPTVWVTTYRLPPSAGGGSVCISVRDNGPGIPSAIIDKIFQPFFTTKPTGQGTGLGLSLSYDIIKAHGGELTVKTREGEGAEFMIGLPIQ